MENHTIHHIHVRCGKEIFTISHNNESISFNELNNIMTQIALTYTNKYFKDQNKKGA